MEHGYNTRCPAVKRILREAQELHLATEEYFAQPLEDNLFEWHFTVRGPIDSEFEDGIYHGRIILPCEYPMKPPNIIFTTNNGRFEINKKICLSISGYHPETWRPSWSIRTALLAIIGYMPSQGMGNIASLDYSPEERKILAKRSVQHVCPECGPVCDVLLPRTSTNAAALSKEAKEISKQMDVTEKLIDEKRINGSDINAVDNSAISSTTTEALPLIDSFYTTTPTSDAAPTTELRQRVDPVVTISASDANTMVTQSSATKASVPLAVPALQACPTSAAANSEGSRRSTSETSQQVIEQQLQYIRQQQHLVGQQRPAVRAAAPRQGRQNNLARLPHWMLVNNILTSVCAMVLIFLLLRRLCILVLLIDSEKTLF